MKSGSHYTPALRTKSGDGIWRGVNGGWEHQQPPARGMQSVLTQRALPSKGRWLRKALEVQSPWGSRCCANRAGQARAEGTPPCSALPSQHHFFQTKSLGKCTLPWAHRFCTSGQESKKLTCVSTVQLFLFLLYKYVGDFI